MILATIASPRVLPRSLNCPRWNECRLHSERIYDGILNGELPYGKNGITLNDPNLLNSLDLTVRHVDLKRWMRTHYPEHRPGFLFSRGERMAHPFITMETGQAILVERLALQAALEQARREMRELQEQHDTLLKQSSVLLASKQCEISERAETTYLKHHWRDVDADAEPVAFRRALFQLQNARRPLSLHWSPTTAAPWASLSAP
jgi:hypothetical protein